MEFPVTLVHPDLPDREIEAATSTSLRTHQKSGWKPKAKPKKSTSGGSKPPTD